VLDWILCESSWSSSLDNHSGCYFFIHDLLVCASGCASQVGFDVVLAVRFDCQVSFRSVSAQEQYSFDEFVWLSAVDVSDRRHSMFFVLVVTPLVAHC